MNAFFSPIAHPVVGRAALLTMGLVSCFASILTVGCGSKNAAPVHAPAETGNATMEESEESTERSAANGTAAKTTDTDALPAFDRMAEIRRSEQLKRSGDLVGAAAALQRVLLTDPNDAEVLFRFANLQTARGNLDEAISLLDSIPADHPQAGLAALGQAADWCLQIERYEDAESRYLRILEIAPDAAIARRQLAHLYNRQGRRHEAAVQIQRLCRLGDVREDELHSLMSLSDAIYDDPNDAEALPQGRQPYWPIGPLAEARKRFSERQYSEAADLLHDYVTISPVLPAVKAFYGRALAEAQDELRFIAWLDKVDPATRQFAEYWAAVGAYLIDHQRFEEGLRALGESLRRDPTDGRSISRLNQALEALGKHDEAKLVNNLRNAVRTVTLTSGRIGASLAPDLDEFPVLVQGLIDLGRPLEAVTWQLIEAFYRQLPTAETEELNKHRMVIASSNQPFAADVVQMCDIDLDLYPLPKLKMALEATATEMISPTLKVESLPKPRFENIADQIGLNHCYRVASTPQPKRFAIYQQGGGAVAVIDYDLDGEADLYFAQGGCDPPKFIGNQTNTLYRSLDGQLRDVTQASCATEHRYSIGLTVGDWNQDGLPDLVVSNLGANALLINQGDGTFTTEATDPRDDATIMSTSLALADVTGDALPDIVEINYCQDAKMSDRPVANETGEFKTVGPYSYEPAIARVLVNDGTGARQVRPISDSDQAKAPGWGVVITDFDSIPGNEIFVGNDYWPDQWWKQNGEGGWIDLARTAGCAVAAGGAKTASMGIAAGDFDRSGTIDFYITNFENEPASFFLNRGGTFQERSVQYKLASDSYAVLGFGCQAIDYHNDGQLDLVVTNGHVDDTGEPGQRFEQPPQVFANLGDRFQLLNVNDPSHYFGSDHVGRALARLDFNRDGKSDFVVTHLESPSALLINRTETDNHWLQIQLVGTQCERDAIGAKIGVRCGNQQWTGWVTAGDGFLCHNESIVSFGLGGSAELEELAVTWPTGEQQHFKSIAIDQRILIVQGQATAFPL